MNVLVISGSRKKICNQEDVKLTTRHPMHFTSVRLLPYPESENVSINSKTGKTFAEHDGSFSNSCCVIAWHKWTPIKILLPLLLLMLYYYFDICLYGFQTKASEQTIGKANY